MKWLGGFLMTLCPVCLLVMAWEPGHEHWLPLLVTAVIALVWGAGIYGSLEEGEDDGEGN